MQQQRDEGKDVAPSRGRDTTNIGAGRPGGQASQVGVGEGPGGEDRGGSSSSSSSERGGPPGLGGSGYAQGGLTKQMKRSGLASKK